jgi:enoyl-CoA hydratase/carnithine racemase
MYLLTTGKQLSGRDAETAGLVSKCVPKAELEGEEAKTVGKILASPLSALREAKNLTLEAEYRELQEGLQREKDAFARLFSGPEAKEGMSAFLEKRAANFAAKP